MAAENHGTGAKSPAVPTRRCPHSTTNLRVEVDIAAHPPDDP